MFGRKQLKSELEFYRQRAAKLEADNAQLRKEKSLLAAVNYTRWTTIKQQHAYIMNLREKLNAAKCVGGS